MRLHRCWAAEPGLQLVDGSDRATIHGTKSNTTGKFGQDKKFASERELSRVETADGVDHWAFMMRTAIVGMPRDPAAPGSWADRSEQLSRRGEQV